MRFLPSQAVVLQFDMQIAYRRSDGFDAAQDLSHTRLNLQIDNDLSEIRRRDYFFKSDLRDNFAVALSTIAPIILPALSLMNLKMPFLI